MLLDADDDESVIELAQDVWDALGSNSYGLEFLHRPRTYKGFFEGRTWLNLSVVPLVLLTILAIDGLIRSQGWWWLVAAVAIAWPVMVWRLFRSAYRRRDALAQRELPHL